MNPRRQLPCRARRISNMLSLWYTMNYLTRLKGRFLWVGLQALRGSAAVVR